MSTSPRAVVAPPAAPTPAGGRGHRVVVLGVPVDRQQSRAAVRTGGRRSVAAGGGDLEVAVGQPAGQARRPVAGAAPVTGDGVEQRRDGPRRRTGRCGRVLVDGTSSVRSWSQRAGRDVGERRRGLIDSRAGRRSFCDRARAGDRCPGRRSGDAAAELPARARIVIIGGGVGGASIAYHLAELGERDVVLLDRDELTSGSTFHSAGLVGQLRADPTLTRMNMYSVELYRGCSDRSTPPGWVESRQHPAGLQRRSGWRRSADSSAGPARRACRWRRSRRRRRRSCSR